MHRRSFILSLIGAAAGGVALSTKAVAAPQTPWEALQSLEAETPFGDLPALGAQEAQRRHRGGHRRYYRGHRGYGRRRFRRGWAWGHYYGPPRRRWRRRVCRVFPNRYGQLVRRCWWR
jgi:hypothetical protein